MEKKVSKLINDQIDKKCTVYLYLNLLIISLKRGIEWFLNWYNMQG